MKQIFLSIPFIALTACTDYNNAFDCPPKPGLGCKSISEVHGSIIEDSHGKDALIIPQEEENACCQRCQESGDPLPTLKQRVPYGVTSGERYIQRIPERIIRVWVKGRVNQAGDYEGDRYIFVALKDDGWAELKKREVLDGNDE